MGEILYGGNFTYNMKKFEFFEKNSKKIGQNHLKNIPGA
jgi:hypothetical protein